jgi:hypothetical protein
VWQLSIGIAVSLLNIAIHASVMAPMTRSAYRMGQRTLGAEPLVRMMLVMVATVWVLMLAHLAEIGVWTLIYRLLHVTPPGADVFYFAFVSYATLGYGDVVPVPEWRLLGPMAGMDGVLLFGWSTAVMFEVLRKVQDR